MDKKKIYINIRIADIPLRINIASDEEELFRAAAKEANASWSKWRDRFVDRPQTEVMAMVLFLYAKGYMTLRSQIEDGEKMLAEFETDLDSMLAREMARDANGNEE